MTSKIKGKTEISLTPRFPRAISRTSRDILNLPYAITKQLREIQGYHTYFFLFSSLIGMVSLYFPESYL